MEDHNARAAKSEKKANKKLRGWGPFGPKASSTISGDIGKPRESYSGMEKSQTTIEGTSTPTGTKLLGSSGVDTSKEEMINREVLPSTNWILGQSFRKPFTSAKCPPEGTYLVKKLASI